MYNEDTLDRGAQAARCPPIAQDDAPVRCSPRGCCRLATRGAAIEPGPRSKARRACG